MRKQIIQRATLRNDSISSDWCKSTQIKFVKATVAIIAIFVFTWLPYQVKIWVQNEKDPIAFFQKFNIKMTSFKQNRMGIENFYFSRFSIKVFLKRKKKRYLRYLPWAHDELGF